MSNHNRKPRGAPSAGLLCAAVMLLLFPAALLVDLLAGRHPALTELLYSRGLYRLLSGLFAPVFGVFPFSVAELLLLLLAAFLLFLLVRALLRIRRFSVIKLGRFLVRAGAVLAAGYFLFVALWGLNYDRLPLAQNLGYQTGSPTAQELAAVMAQEVSQVNGLCGRVDFGKNGSVYPGGFAKMRGRVDAGYAALAKQTRLVRPIRAHPKGVLLSPLMSYTGIEGIFIPFTYEPNVNTQCPDFVLAFDIAHESAHLQGFAREDEANFVAYLADGDNPDPYFRYAGHLMGLIYVSNALYATDPGAWEPIFTRLDKRAVSDLKSYNDFVTRHQGPAQNLSDKINNSYLESQGQPGTVSYDMFVNLLCDRYRTGLTGR